MSTIQTDGGHRERTSSPTALSGLRSQAGVAQTDNGSAVLDLEDRKLVLSALQEEFGWIRAEIGRLVDHQKELNQSSFVALAAVLAFVGVLLNSGSKQAVAPVLLLVPLVSLMFALAAGNISRQILEYASFLQEITITADRVLKPVMPGIFSPEERRYYIVWTWESWKSYYFFRKLKRSGRFLTRVLESAKGLPLLFPGIVSLLVFLIIYNNPLESYRFWISTFILVISAILLFLYSEARGIESMEGIEFEPFSHRANLGQVSAGRAAPPGTGGHGTARPAKARAARGHGTTPPRTGGL
jgi:hypothetical protein